MKEEDRLEDGAIDATRSGPRLAQARAWRHRQPRRERPRRLPRSDEPGYQPFDSSSSFPARTQSITCSIRHTKAPSESSRKETDECRAKHR